MNQPIRYIIAIRPPEHIIVEVKEMKLALKKAIGGFYNSVNSEAHITLFEFYAYDEHYPALLNELSRAVKMLAPFDLEFQGFNHFATTGAFYIQLTSESSRSIIERCIQFRNTLSSEVLSVHTEGWTDMFATPHMTIGRRLRADWIETAYSLFDRFDAKFWCSSLAVRKFNDDRKQFDVIAELAHNIKTASSPKTARRFPSS